MSKILLLCLCFSFVPFGLASFWDGIIVISQIKSVVQALTHDYDGAKKTQDQFLSKKNIFKLKFKIFKRLK